MTTATPETLVDVLAQVIREAAQAAAEQPGAIADTLRDALGEAKEVTRLPEEALTALKDAIKNPDWWSLLAFCLCRVAELDDKGHLVVGARDPSLPDQPQWSKALTLTYLASPGDDSSARAALALALTEEGTKGVILSVDADALSFDLPPPEPPTSEAPTDPIALHVVAHGHGEFRIPFTGEVTWPDTSAHMHMVLSYDPPDPKAGDIATIGLGPIYIEADLAASAPRWAVVLGMGRPPARPPGLMPELHLHEALGEPFAEMLQVTVPSFSPKVTLADGVPPRYDLGASRT